MPEAHKCAYVHTDVWYEMAGPPSCPEWEGSGGEQACTLLGEGQRVLRAHPNLCLDSLVVIAASWGLRVGFQISGSRGD